MAIEIRKKNVGGDILENEMLHELRIQNLLLTMYQMPYDNKKKERHQKILNYIFDEEMSKLQLDLLYPSNEDNKTPVKKYKFH